jgi:hypothetical protein
MTPPIQTPFLPFLYVFRETGREEIKGQSQRFPPRSDLHPDHNYFHAALVGVIVWKRKSAIPSDCSGQVSAVRDRKEAHE